MKKILFIVILMSFGSLSVAQDFIDNALLFSRPRPSGSARIQALGGSQVSLGGDYSSALSNPAGLGMYNRSEVTLGLGLTNTNISTDYLGTKTDASKSMFNIPGLSFVYHHESDKEKGFLGGSFGISMIRTNDFNRKLHYRGENNQNSIVDYFIDDAYGANPRSFTWPENQAPGENFTTLTGLAYNTFLIEDMTDADGNPIVDDDGRQLYGSVLSPLPAEGTELPAEVRTVDQDELSESKGSQYQWSISYGANFGDKLFVGAGIGITSIRYKVTQYFTESNFRYTLRGVDTGYDPIDHLTMTENYDIRGSGVNFTIGAIYRPVDFIQVGASLVTPTYNKITDTYTARTDSEWNMYGNPDAQSYPPRKDVSEHFEDIPVISEYNLSTPMRVTTGLTLISKFGFITGDVEFVNYSKAKYNSDMDDDFSPENDGVKAEYTSVVNYRVGAEYRYKIYRIRGGYNFMADPLRQTGDVDRSVQSFSGGLGVRTKSFFVDLGAVFSATEGSRSPYYTVVGDIPISYQKVNSSNYIVTVGFTF